VASRGLIANLLPIGSAGAHFEVESFRLRVIDRGIHEFTGLVLRDQQTAYAAD
jgi:hypothetical protein